jgi:hypothetical protein
LLFLSLYGCARHPKRRGTTLDIATSSPRKRVPSPRDEYINEAGDTSRALQPAAGFSARRRRYANSSACRNSWGRSRAAVYGEQSERQDKHAAVLAIDVGSRDLQQCADAALRLRCEYKFSVGDYEGIDYHLTNGFEFPYAKYREGYRLEVEGNKTRLVKAAQPDDSYETFRKYLNVLFNYASTRSLSLECETIPLQSMEIGDVFLISGAPGHCVVVMDMCENDAGDKAVLLGQSSMPAQQIHILRFPDQESPWLNLNEVWFPLKIYDWEYTKENVMRMP